MIIEHGKERTPAHLASWSSEGEPPLTCRLCPHGCVLAEGELGICGTRSVLDGRMVALNYGMVCAQAVDQIEKKPIYHYRPGSKLLSVGTFGCNLDCDCCQNAALAMASADQVNCPIMSPAEAVDLALKNDVQGIAFTFNEPIVWYEFIMDTAELARKAGLYVMMNTNGFVEEGPLEQLCSRVDVFKVDVKGFTEDFYMHRCGGSLPPVLRTCEMVNKRGRHLELAYLLIPGLNDRREDVSRFFEWAAGTLGGRVPVHLYRFMPAHRLSHLEPTKMEALHEAKNIGAKAGMDFVYLSGMIEGEEHATACPSCGKVVIERAAKEVAEKVVFSSERLSKFCPSYSEIIDRTRGGRCPDCNEIIYKIE